MARKATKGGFSYSLLAPESEWTAPDVLPSLSGVKRISLDVETNDPNLKELGPGTIRGDAYVCGLAVGIDNGPRFYLPTRHQGGGNMDEGLIWRWAKEELNNFEGIVVGAKLIYDLDHLWNYGVTMPKVKRFHDIQIAEPLLDETKFEYNLESLAKEYLGENKVETLLVEAAKSFGFGTSNDDIKANLWRMPASYVGPYGEGDADLPLRILDKQLVKLEELGLLELFDMESQLLPILLAVRRRGVRVNVAGAGEVRAKLVAARDTALARVRRLAGPKAELMAPDSFAQALVDRGLPVGRTAKSGQWSITKGWLTSHAGDALVDGILEGRKLNTTITTFIDGHIFNHAINGRIHCEFVQLKDGDGGTGSRFSSRNPNLQNVPSRDEELAGLVRSLFLPDEGCDWECQDQCLVGDTEVVTIDGVMTIRDLVANPVPVLSTADCKTLMFKPVIAARKTGIKPIYLVTLDDGSSVKCTDNHRWMSFENEEIYTRDLKPWTKLAHVHEGMGGRGDTPSWYLRSNRKAVYKHRLVADYEYGPCPDGHEVDHKDTEHKNWWRSNLQYLPITINRGMAAGIWWDRATPEQRLQKTESLMKGIQENRRSYKGEGNPNFGKRGKGGPPKTGAMVACDECKTEFYRIPSRTNRFCSSLCASSTGSNHKVRSVKFFGYEEVYDITVEGTHTFVLGNGLVSHNSQMEYRLQVHYARGVGAREAREKYINDPSTDFHKMCAEFIGIDPEDKSQRKQVKSLNFSKTYGALAPKIALQFGCTLDEAKAFIAKYEAALPFTVTTFNDAQAAAQKNGFVRSILGRYAHFPLWEPTDNFKQKREFRQSPLPRARAEAAYGDKIIRANTYKALNNILQFSNADYTKKTMVDVWNAGLCTSDNLGAFLLQVHDELDYSVPRTVKGDEAVREAKHIMETAIKLRVPVMVSSKRGPTWGSCG